MPVSGMSEISRKMKAIGDRAANNAARRSARQGANIIRDAARANAARLDNWLTPENISKNITTKGVRKRTEQAIGGVMMRVGVLGGARDMSKYGEIKGSGKGNPGGDTFYWRFLEFGTSKMAARPFMRPAMNAKADAAYNAVASSISGELDKELKKVGVK